MKRLLILMLAVTLFSCAHKCDKLEFVEVIPHVYVTANTDTSNVEFKRYLTALRRKGY